MKTIFGSNDGGVRFKAHIAQTTTTLATLWKVTLKSGTVLGFTDASSNLTLNGLTYLAATSYNASAIASSSNMSVDNLEVVGALSAASVNEKDLTNGVWDYAQVTLYLVNYMDLTMGYIYLRSGYLGTVSTHRNSFTAEIRGLMQALQQPFGHQYYNDCDANFCDARCTLVAATFTFAGTVTSVTDGRYFTTSLTNADNYFTNGVLTMTSGQNVGIAKEIRSSLHTGQFVLQEMLPFVPAVGDAVSALAGCSKTRDSCIAFSNMVHYRGFPDIPGQDRMISGQ